MTTDVAGDFAAAGRMADMDHILEIEFFDKFREIVGVSVKIVAVPGLLRATMAAPVMCDAAVATLGQKEHLVLKGIGI